jgi:diacylglycerol kinase (ATP)
VIVFKEAGYRLVLDSLRGLALGGIDLMTSTSYVQTESFTVRTKHEVPVEVDGEWVGRFSEVRFAQTASRLRVFAPVETPAGNFAEVFKSLLQWPRRQLSPETARHL